jgi:hypothetical protein
MILLLRFEDQMFVLFFPAKMQRSKGTKVIASCAFFPPFFGCFRCGLVLFLFVSLPENLQVKLSKAFSA